MTEKNYECLYVSSAPACAHLTTCKAVDVYVCASVRVRWVWIAGLGGYVFAGTHACLHVDMYGMYEGVRVFVDVSERMLEYGERCLELSPVLLHRSPTLYLVLLVSV